MLEEKPQQGSKEAAGHDKTLKKLVARGVKAPPIETRNRYEALKPENENGNELDNRIENSLEVPKEENFTPIFGISVKDPPRTASSNVPSTRTAPKAASKSMDNTQKIDRVFLIKSKKIMNNDSDDEDDDDDEPVPDLIEEDDDDSLFDVFQKAM